MSGVGGEESEIGEAKIKCIKEEGVVNWGSVVVERDILNYLSVGNIRI